MTRIDSHRGHYWIRLATDAEIDAEAEAMRIRITRQAWMQDLTDTDPTHDGVWSLRDAEGQRVLTAEVHREWEDWYSSDSDEDYTCVSGTNIDEVRGPGDRPANADEVLHVAPLRAWFLAHAAKLEPPVWRDPGTIVQTWTTRSKSHVDRHVKTLHVTEMGERVHEVKDERIHPILIYADQPMTSVDGISSGSVAMVVRGKDDNLQMLKDDRWEDVEIRDGVRIGVMGQTVEAMPGRLKVIPPRYREFVMNHNRSIVPQIARGPTMDYADGTGPGLHRLVVVGLSMGIDGRRETKAWERADA